MTDEDEERYGCPHCKDPFTYTTTEIVTVKEVHKRISISASTGEVDDEGIDTPEFVDEQFVTYVCGKCGERFDAALYLGE